VADSGEFGDVPSGSVVTELVTGSGGGLMSEL
jgi:hypothetical protein